MEKSMENKDENAFQRKDTKNTPTHRGLPCYNMAFLKVTMVTSKPSTNSKSKFPFHMDGISS